MLPVNLLPAPYDHTAFIAGGFAACPALAEDVDVWCPVDIMSAPHDDPFELVWTERDRVVAYLHREFGSCFIEHDGINAKRHEVPTLPSIRHGKLVTTFEGYHLPIAIRRAGMVTMEGCSLPYHIILVGGDVDEVLSSFDISTHAVALTRKGVVCSEYWTSPLEEPKVIHQKYTTDARLVKVKARYSRIGTPVADFNSDQR